MFFITAGSGCLHLRDWFTCGMLAASAKCIGLYLFTAGPMSSVSSSAVAVAWSSTCMNNLDGSRLPQEHELPQAMPFPFMLMMCSQLRVQMVAFNSMPWPRAKRHCVARQYTESACRGASIASFASHEAAILCVSPGPRVCVVYTIRLASSELGRLFFPF